MRVLFCIFLFLVGGLAANDTELGLVKLRWNSAELESLAGSRIHYGKESGVYTEMKDVGLTLALTHSLDDPNLFVENGVPYPYVFKGSLALPVGETFFSSVTVYNAYGLESDYSNEITFTVRPLRVLDIGFRVNSVEEVE